MKKIDAVELSIEKCAQLVAIDRTKKAGNLAYFSQIDLFLDQFQNRRRNGVGKFVPFLNERDCLDVNRIKLLLKLVRPAGRRVLFPVLSISR